MDMVEISPWLLFKSGFIVHSELKDMTRKADQEKRTAQHIETSMQK